MGINFRRIAAGAALLATFASPPAFSAAIYTMGFSDYTAPSETSNALYKTFRFSPNCHFHIMDDTWPGFTGQWLGWDMAGCTVEGMYNENFLGPAELAGPNNTWGVGIMYIDRPGSLFSMLSVDIAEGHAVAFYSSNGGFAAGWMNEEHHSEFSGPEWTNLEWLIVTGGGGDPHGMDNLVLSVVPEPGTALLAGLGLAAVAWRRRKT